MRFLAAVLAIESILVKSFADAVDFMDELSTRLAT
jgi:hypothetical protein